MTSVVEDLIEAGIHFGQKRSAWNPRMKPFIYGTRNKIHIIDIRETVKGLLRARKLVEQIVAGGKDVCFVGTKRQARSSIEKYATDVGMPYVIERWLGGTLTNFQTIRSRLKRLEELEKLEESGEIENYSKKMESQLIREKRKIKRNLEGIRNMHRLPGALIVIDQMRETNALREAKSLGITTICLIDTDGNPELVDLPIPGNDDSMRSIEVVIRELADAVVRGKTARRQQAEGADEQSGDEQKPKRRSSRAAFRADESSAGDDHAEDSPAAEVGRAPAAATMTAASPPPPATPGAQGH